MTPEEQRIAIAEACGWKRAAPVGQMFDNRWFNSDETEMRLTAQLPDYLNDLNACHEIEKVLNNAEYHTYEDILGREVVYRDNGREMTGKRMNTSRISATAAQRCEAFLRVKGLLK